MPQSKPLGCCGIEAASLKSGFPVLQAPRERQISTRPKQQGIGQKGFCQLPAEPLKISGFKKERDMAVFHRHYHYLLYIII